VKQWEPHLRSRVVIATTLAVLTIMLLVVEPHLNGSSRSTPSAENTRLVDQVVDSLIIQYGVKRDKIKKWQVRLPDGRRIRTERRVLVPLDFVSVEFNRDLNRAVAQYGAKVSGTERTKESVVVFHIVQEGITTHTIALVEE